MSYPKSDYSLVEYKVSDREGKKYMAILKNKNTGRKVKVHFGAKGYEHYRDSTPLKRYSSSDHKDLKRRENYRKRHARHVDFSRWSPALFSWTKLWSLSERNL